ncbi:MAG: hypothetical protein RL215_1058 [Planctomycetota bacterium]|jgi:hypothetical protein
MTNQVLAESSGANMTDAVRRAWSDGEADGEFDYIPVSPWAPIALVMGGLSLTGFMGFFGLYVAAFGIFVGCAAVMRIRSGGGAVKGMWMAFAGLILSTISLTGGSVKMAHAWSTEVPEGYRRVHFPSEIADQQFVYVGGRRKIPPPVAELVGKPLYIKGFMWATQATDGIPRFILLKDNGECCFGGKPKSHDFITVTLKSYPDGARPSLASRAPGMSDVVLTPEQQKAFGAQYPNQLTTQAFIGMVAVAGVLHADPQAGEGGSPEDYEFAQVYTMDAELVEEVWTPF